MTSSQVTWWFAGEADAVARAGAAAASRAVISADEILRVALATGAVDRGLVHAAGVAFYLAQGQRFGLNDGPAEDLNFEVLRSLPAPAVNRSGGIATVTGEGPDAVTVLSRSAADAHSCAAAIFGEVAASIRASHNPQDDVWEQLSKGAKLASTLKASGKLNAAVMAWRGRGRIVGPIQGDLLMRFGVSAWR